MVKNVVFDIGGVLVKTDFDRFLNTITKELNIPTKDLINKYTNGFHLDYMKGKLTSEQFVDIICKKYNRTISVEKFEKLWYLILLEQDDNVADIVDYLHKQYQLAIISNIDPWHYDYCKTNFSVIGTFKRFFLSYECNLLKPDPQFFKLVLEQLNEQPGQCLLIDDRLDNIQAAEKIGYQVIQFKNAAQLLDDLKEMGIMN